MSATFSFQNGSWGFPVLKAVTCCGSGAGFKVFDRFTWITLVFRETICLDTR